MKKNNLTLSQSLKLYTGNSIPEFVLKFSLPALFMYLSSLVFFLIMLGLASGFDYAQKEISESLVSNMFMAIDCSIAVGTIMSITFEKKLPGGKFFRTVKGGFDTYKKMRTAMTVAIMINLMVYIVMAYIVSATGIFPLINAAESCISVFIFMVLSIGISNLLHVIKNDIARPVMNMIIVMISGVIGIFSVYIAYGRLGAVHVAAAVISAVLIPVSHKAMLSDYRKNRWDN